MWMRNPSTSSTGSPSASICNASFWQPASASACLRSLMSTSMFTAPTSVPESLRSGVGWAISGTRVPSGRSATISAPLMARFSRSVTAIGH